MPVPQTWQAFVKDYRADGRFQYFPHAHVGTDRYPKIISALSTFDGKVWHEKTVMAALRAAKLTAGRSSGGRMIRQAAVNLGLCMFHDHVMSLTAAGFDYIDGGNRDELLRRTLWRYQLDNPANEGAVGFDLFPHAALIELLLELPDHRLTRDEFILFFGRCRTRQALPATLHDIKRWRKLSVADQDAIMRAAGKEFQTRATDSSYAMGFHALAGYLERFNDDRRRQGIRLRKKGVDQARERLDLHLKGAQKIDFGPEASFAAALGDVDQSADLRDTVDYYLDRSQYDKAVKAFGELPPAARGGKTKAEFEAEVFLERDLEAYLKKNLGKIEPGLKLIGSQCAIRAGVMDLYARAKNGDHVVIELKKGRASDQVFGQLCRYIGCLRLHEAKGKTVRGYIIGSDIDQKLRFAAVTVGDASIRLQRYRRDPASPAIFIED